MLWSFSRDHGMPFSFLWARVNHYFGIPVNAVRPGTPSFSSFLLIAATGMCLNADFRRAREAVMLHSSVSGTQASATAPTPYCRSGSWGPLLSCWDCPC